MNIEPKDFESLFLNSTAWLDVRAPVEFQAGAVPESTNIPLLTDDERQQVGLTYKQQGPRAAIELGHRLVRAEIKETRVQAWRQFMEENPNAAIYCFRGGLRSQIVQGWLSEVGIERPLVMGGFKALRRFLLQTLDTQLEGCNFEVVSGPTGSGKTHFLRASGRMFLDLEALANHRGSAFGSYDTPQPSQICFENALAIELLKLRHHGEKILVENESRLIGKCIIPHKLFQKIRSSPKTRLEVSFDERIENIFKDYIVNSRLGQNNDPSRFNDFRKSVMMISRKLGSLRAQEILADIEQSQSRFLNGQGLGSNRIWIAKLLKWYYDPLYR